MRELVVVGVGDTATLNAVVVAVVDAVRVREFDCVDVGVAEPGLQQLHDGPPVTGRQQPHELEK